MKQELYVLELPEMLTDTIEDTSSLIALFEALLMNGHEQLSLSIENLRQIESLLRKIKEGRWLNPLSEPLIEMFLSPWYTRLGENLFALNLSPHFMNRIEFTTSDDLTN
jgi:hypothetical protein